MVYELATCLLLGLFDSVKDGKNTNHSSMGHLIVCCNYDLKTTFFKFSEDLIMSLCCQAKGRGAVVMNSFHFRLQYQWCWHFAANGGVR